MSNGNRRSRKAAGHKDIVLSIGVLASDRRDTIERCLASLDSIRNAVPSELIIVDTGCGQEVRGIIERYGDIVERFAWCDDFSAARNELLKYASGEWFLFLDDDEWFVDTAELIEFFVSGEYRKYGYAAYIQRNYLDMEASRYSDSWVSRMTRLDAETHFESKIHEYMVPMNGDCKGIRSHVDHFGYVYETEDALWKHYERNRVLLEEMIREEPQQLRWRIELAQEYRSVKEFQKLYDLGEECLELAKNRTDRTDLVALGAFYGAKILALFDWKQWEEGLRVCEEAEKDKRNTELFQAFVALQKAGFHYWLGNYDQAERCAQEYLRWCDFFAENEPLLFLQKAVPFVGECLDEVMKKEAYSELICCGLKSGSIAYLEQYLDKLRWDEPYLYVFEDIAATLVHAMNTMEICPIFEKTIHLIHGNTALWDYFVDEIDRTEKAGINVHKIVYMIRGVLHMDEEDAAKAQGALRQEEGGKDSGGQATQATEELQQLAAGIKEQIRILIANGMKAEAKQVIGQLKQMLPEDGELAELEKNTDECTINKK